MRRLIAFILVISCGLSQASTEVRGQLEVTKSCSAYVSKNKKSNPGQVTILPGEEYSIFEINRSENPDWLRVEIPDHEYPLRWIATECGEANYQIIDAKTCDQSPGRADSYVLALSWQPAFCQTYGYEAGKPECANLKSKSYAASHLALHGLWPNQDSCGQNYGFCGVDPKSNHCDYPPLSLNTDVAANLRVFMPSFAYGSCLERHEWYKHGSCQILSSDTYYTLAMRLAKEADLTKFGQYLHNHLGEAVTKTQLEETLKQSFGKTASKKVFLGCKNGYLVDVFIYLPPLIPLQESLESLVGKTTELNRSTGCPSTIYISDFTKG